jgi:hypothetical protein
MRLFILAALAALGCLGGLASFGSAGNQKTVAPVVCWYPPAYYSSAGPVPQPTIHLITRTEDWQDYWKRSFSKYLITDVDFTDHFVVVVTKPLGLRLHHLAINARGDAKLRGSFLFADDRNSIAVATTIAVLPRNGVKSVEGRPLPAGEKRPGPFTAPRFGP